MKLVHTPTGFTISHKNRTVFEHSEASPALYLGIGEGNFDMYRGNFDITDYVIERLPLRQFKVDSFERDGQEFHSIGFYFDGKEVIQLIVGDTT